jgi:hypothetical protein
MRLASIGARPEGSTLPGLRRRRPRLRRGFAALLAPRGGCDGPAWAAGHGPCISPSRRSCTACRTAPSALRCSPAPMRPVRALPSGLKQRWLFATVKYKGSLPARLRAGGFGSELAAPRSAGLVAARVSALRDLTRRSCPSVASAARAASSAAGREPEHRRAVGAQRRPLPPERTGPHARSLARSGQPRDAKRKTRVARRDDRCA